MKSRNVLLMSVAVSLLSVAISHAADHKYRMRKYYGDGPVGGMSGSSSSSGGAQNVAPFFSTIGLDDGAVGIPYSAMVSAGDDDAGDTLAIRSVTAPGWVTVTDNHDRTAVISGTPASAGDATLTLEVDDGHGGIVQSIYTIVVEDDAAPVFTSTPGPTFPAAPGIVFMTTVTGFSYNIAATDANATDTLTISLAEGPADMILTHVPGVSPALATLAWNPVAYEGMPTTYNIRLEATDGRGALVSQAFPLNLNAGPGWISPAAGSLGTVVMGQAITPIAFVADAIAAPVSYALATGAFPPGLTLSGDTLSGTPTTAGTYNFSILATDAMASPTSGRAFSMVVDEPLQSAMCWGYNSYGSVGDGTTTQRTVPTTVSGGLAFSSLGGGQAHSCGITTSGAAYCWGTNNGYGALGDGNETGSQSVPTAVVGGLTFTADIGGGQSHTCALGTSGTVYCWGDNRAGQVGNGGVGSAVLSPTAVSGGYTFFKVASADLHNCAITTAGSAYCWGRGAEGQLGDGTTTQKNVPTAVSGGHVFTDIAAGDRHTCAIKDTGAAYCWGNNDYGQVGNGTWTSPKTSPVAVSGGHLFIQIAVGSGHSCGLKADGSAYCWGINSLGMLGNGSTTDSNVPVLVSGGHAFGKIVADGYRTCGLGTDNAGYCWGYNASGELGDGTTTQRNVPTPVSGGHTFSILGAGGATTCGIGN